MNIADLKNSKYLICVKTHICNSFYGEQLEYLQGVKYRCAFEENEEFNCINIEYPNGNGWCTMMLLSENDNEDSRYFKERFITLNEYRKLLINELL